MVIIVYGELVYKETVLQGTGRQGVLQYSIFYLYTVLLWKVGSVSMLTPLRGYTILEFIFTDSLY